ncbi:hypothetical protein FVB9532_01816 [Mesonia oceanica]|uniref:Uncharacterized protein n=1 Tax=Mesonia oceanica TaxID=2687242 RepID=A0AC61YB04_9FLAO|nr:hypothetical protein FVB9532_01816 [Mesonia oceanica]
MISIELETVYSKNILPLYIEILHHFKTYIFLEFSELNLILKFIFKLFHIG